MSDFKYHKLNETHTRIEFVPTYFDVLEHNEISRIIKDNLEAIGINNVSVDTSLCKLKHKTEISIRVSNEDALILKMKNMLVDILGYLQDYDFDLYVEFK